MLRITVSKESDDTTVRLEGRLVNAWVDELSACWGQLRAGAHQPIRIDLDGLTYIDEGGKAVLRAMHADGAILAATSVTMRAFVADVAEALTEHCGSARSPRR